MALEEQTQKYSNSSSGGGGGSGGTGGGGGGSSSKSGGKKLKQKKVPQRGLGVAQLERIRIEELRKRDAASLQMSSTLLPPDSSIVFSGNKFLPAVSLILPDAPTNALDLPNSVRKQHSLNLNGDATHQNSGSISMSNNNVNGGSEMGWPSSGSGNWPKLWSSTEYNLEGESRNLDCCGLAIHPNNPNLTCETKTPAWPFSGIAHRSEQFQHPCPPMVNVPSGTSNSSMLNFQMEPPSNQNYGGNSSTALWPEEERMVGMKRTCPFAIEDAPCPSLNTKYPRAYSSFISQRDEAALSSNDGVSSMQPANPPFLREFLPSSSGRSDSQKKISKEAGSFNGDFLSLAPPKIELPPPYLSTHQEVPDFDALPYQFQAVGDNTVKWPEVVRPVQQTFYNFLPPASTQNGQSVGNTNNGEHAEVVDLNLKL